MSDDVLLTSVPATDHALVRSLLPGAIVTEAPLSEALADAYPDVSVLSVMVHDRVPDDVVRWWPGLTGVVTRSAGFDHLPLRALAAREVVACSLHDYAVSSVAHLTVGFVLSLLRRVPEAMAVTSPRQASERPCWDRSGLVGRHLADVEVGVLGVGRIGSAVVRALTGLGARVRGFDVVQDEGMRDVSRFRYVAPLAAFAEGLDVLTVHVPLTQDTRGMVDAGVIGRLARGALVVNTARGEVVDQVAVANALRSGRLGGYAADVLPGEPNPPDLSRFQDFTNVILTPHLGAYDQRAIRARYEETAAAVHAIRSGDQTALAPYLART